MTLKPFLLLAVYNLINTTRKIEPSFTIKLVMSTVRFANYSTVCFDNSLNILLISLDFTNFAN